MRLPTVPGVLLSYPYREWAYTAPTPRTWLGRTWYRFKSARWEREHAEHREWRRSALKGAVCSVCGVSVPPETCFVQWTEDPSTRTRRILAVRCKEHAEDST
jgi:hypothetical protein